MPKKLNKAFFYVLLGTKIEGLDWNCQGSDWKKFIKIQGKGNQGFYLLFAANKKDTNITKDSTKKHAQMNNW